MKNLISRDRWLQNDLQVFLMNARDGFKTCRPFGTFKKATYIVKNIHKVNLSQEVYRLTTTIYTQDEVIVLLREKRQGYKVMIVKIVDGCEGIVFRDHIDYKYANRRVDYKKNYQMSIARNNLKNIEFYYDHSG